MVNKVNLLSKPQSTSSPSTADDVESLIRQLAINKPDMIRVKVIALQVISIRLIQLS